MSFIVYILFSEKFNKHYTGFTSNLELRLKSHNEFGNDWTAKYRPWKLVYTKEIETKKEAMDYEKWLKTGTGRDFIKSLPH
jgi:putative endonuclease